MAKDKRGPLQGVEVVAGRLPPLRKLYLDARRRLLPDPKPLEPPTGYKRSPPLAEQIRAMMQGEALALAARTSGAETFAESDDFDVADDFDPQSPFEVDFEPPASWEDKAERLGEFIERGRRKAEAKFEEERVKKEVKEQKKDDQESKVKSAEGNK